MDTDIYSNFIIQSTKYNTRKAITIILYTFYSNYIMLFRTNKISLLVVKRLKVKLVKSFKYKMRLSVYFDLTMIGKS